MSSFYKGINFDITGDNTLQTDNDEVSIPRHEVPEIASTMLINSGVEFDDSTLNRIEGLDYEGLLSLALACLKSVALMDYSSLEKDSYNDDPGLEELAIKMYTLVHPNISEPEVRELFSKDSETRSHAIKDAQDMVVLVHESDYSKEYSLESELDDTVCSYEQRWDLDRSCVWVSAHDPCIKIFYRHNLWFRSMPPSNIYLPVPTELSDLPEEDFPLMKETNEQ